LMVTANRRELAKRAVQCFKNQTYTNTELVVLDDGEQDYSIIFEGIPEERLIYMRIPKNPDNVLGALRNQTLDVATGDYLVQWDDDDWYHPTRIEHQVNVLNEGNDACCLQSALMHLDDPEFIDQPYKGVLKHGVPGSIMHRRSDTIRYPETKRAEDTVYLNEWRALRYKKLDESLSYLFIRCFHGSNTWEKEHFLRRVRNSPGALIEYLWIARVRNQLFSHSRFQLTDTQRLAFTEYLKESNELDLLDAVTL
ncbi:MAG: glycosyltransferase family A protein, partial [Bacteroidota bacterium]